MSGGLDSAILCAEAVTQYARVHPLYVRFGLQWEAAEIAWLKAFLSAIAAPTLAELAVLDQPVAAIYGNHWSTGGRAVPAVDAANDADYLPGRNLMLLTAAAVWCTLHGIPTVALGTLQANPFPDATPAFDAAMEQAIQRGMNAPFRIERPYLHLSKADVLKRGAGLPLELTFSCVNPVDNRPCGKCIKCGERQRAFAEAGLPDKTRYAMVGVKLCSR